MSSKMLIIFLTERGMGWSKNAKTTGEQWGAVWTCEGSCESKNVRNITICFVFFDLPFNSIKRLEYRAHFRDHVSISSESYFSLKSSFPWGEGLAVTGTEGSGNNMTVRRYIHLNTQMKEKENIWSICCSFIWFSIAVIFSLKENVWLTRGNTNTWSEFLWVCKTFSVHAR